ncbi:UNVERIFIED_CONTAM: Aminopeptidase M1 [Sesamum radiatum]|uniref:Alpha-aminoacylpeptide hydrolase n=1 Tax=Sesamum radiatum TaxID=300843 RepID=A0AAW2WLP9_SESRA
MHSNLLLVESPSPALTSKYCGGCDEILVLVFEEALDVGYGALEIEFSGVLNEQLKGLYRWYFSMPYPLPKLDMVAVPEFSDAAMENFGLITFCETELLQDDLHSAAANVQRLTIVVAHEVAHQWFGNLVTMGWWTHLWLKEGVATWVEIHNAQSVLEYFDAICYRKGSAVIQMLQNYLGDEVFQKSFVSYMKKYAFKNANTEELWSVLSETSGVEVNKIMDTWTKQKGYPVISVKLNDHTLVFEQTQFLSSAVDSDALWLVPLTLSLCSYNNQKRFLLEAKVGNMEIQDVSCSSDVCSSQKTNSNEENVGERILDDTFALCEACSTPFSSLLNLMDTYRKDLEYIVLSRLIDVCCNALKIIRDAIPELASDFKKFFISLLLSHSEKLGWDATPGESQLNALIREEVLTALACFDHPPTKVEAIKRFQVYLEDRNTSLLPVDTRKQAAYIAVMRNASSSERTGLHCLQKIYREVDAGQEKTRILRCMASCPDPVIVSETLDFMLTDEVPHEDAIYVLAGISWEGRSMAWTWFKTNWDLIIKKWGDAMILTYFVRDIIAPFCSYEIADEVEAFFCSHSHSRPLSSTMQFLKQSLELVRIKAQWIEHIKEERSSCRAG